MQLYGCRNDDKKSLLLCCSFICTAHNHWTPRARVCMYLVIPPEPGQAVGVHDAEDFALRILPADVVLVPAVWKELVDVVPQQPAVCQNPTGKRLSEPLSADSLKMFSCEVSATDAASRSFDARLRRR